MVFVRKSSVTQTDNWFQRNSMPSRRRQGRSLSSSSHLESASKPTGETLPVPSRRKRRSRSAQQLPIPVTQGLPEVAKPLLPQLKNQSHTTTQKNPQPGESQIPVMSTAATLPLWLARLYTSHRYSSVVTFLLVTATLCMYGSIVYSQQLWSQGYKNLQNLQLRERQLTTINATLKNKMAEEGEQEDTGLVKPTPDRTIFLPTASPSHNSHVIQPVTPANVETPPNTLSPLGY
ncbi:hypothetical protein [Nodularia chucula]|uniref:hypothetical protein n=1 Tax=Nodularia chucula TaxID=3093667 RepID=UPI0039C6F28A